MKTSYQKTAIDTIINTGAEFLLIPLVLIRMPILTKNLTSQEYGLWGLILTTCSLALPFTSLGLGVAMSRFLYSKQEKEKIQEGFYSVLFLKMFISLIIALSVLFFASPISRLFFDSNVEIVQLIAAFIFFTTLEPIYTRLLRIFRKIKVLSIIKIINGYGAIMLYSILFLTGHGLLSIVFAALALKVVIVSFLILYVKPQIGFSWPNFSQIRKYLWFGLPTLAASMGFWLVNLTDRYVIAYFLGTTSVGIYSAAYTLGQMPYMFVGLINFIMMVAISPLYDEGKMNEVKTHLSYALKYFLLITIPFIFGTAIFSKQVLNILSTNEIATQGWFVTPIVALGYLFLGVYSIVSYILLVTKKTKIMGIVWIFSLPINLGLNIIIVPYLGIVGAAITTLIAYLLAMCVVTFFALKEFTFKANWNVILKSLLASILMSIVVLFSATDGVIFTFLTILSGIVIYGMIVIFLGVFSKPEFEFFKKLLKNSLVKKNVKEHS